MVLSKSPPGVTDGGAATGALEPVADLGFLHASRRREERDHRRVAGRAAAALLPLHRCAWTAACARGQRAGSAERVAARRCLALPVAWEA